MNGASQKGTGDFTKRPLLLLVEGALFILAFHCSVAAQTFTTLHSFTTRSPNSSGIYTNGDGYGPVRLLLSGNTLYGTTGGGGSSGIGTLFKVSTDGSGFTNLLTFTSDYVDPSSLSFTNYEGGVPVGLLLSGNTLYGTCKMGGEWDSGTVFKLNVDGTGFTVLHTFTNTDGALPFAGLILSGATLYGTTCYGGAFYEGTVFSMNTDGNGFATLYSFQPYYTGCNPSSELLLVNDTLYGANSYGGNFPPPQPPARVGNIFSMATNGDDYTIVEQFAAPYYPTLLYPYGAQPSSGLILSGNTLFGTCLEGGSFINGITGNGTVFAVATNGTGVGALHSFTPFINASYENYDGANPSGKLVLSGNTLYGTTLNGGAFGLGLVFRMHTDGTGFAPVHVFSGGNDGSNPSGSLVLSGTTLYGLAQLGGAYGAVGSGNGPSIGGGTVFSISLAPSLTIQSTSASIVLAWPTSFDGFVLQSTTNLSSPVWTTNLPAPVIVNGQNTVTNPVSGTQQFFRLSQ